jgi:sugar lactone lactonase YvrE
MRAELFCDLTAELGEGPLWSGDRLYWFDILNMRLHALDAGGGAPATWQFDEHHSAAGRLPGGRLLLASETGLWRFDPGIGARERVCPIQADEPAIRSNDGRADRQGGFWVGTMHKRAPGPEHGRIWRYHRGRLREVAAAVTIPNGICFAPDGRRGYYSDTARGQIYTWPLDVEGWPTEEATLFADLSLGGGAPDGAVVDAEGALWCALWGGSRLLRIAPDGEPGAEIALPVTQPSCPAFGGDLRRLYVTTAREGLSEDALADQPLAGAVFTAATDVPGLPEPEVELA